MKSAPSKGLAQQGTVTAQSQRWEQAEQEKCRSRTSGSVLVENLQPQARALGPLFITFDTRQARLIYPRVCICSSRAFSAPKSTGLDEEPRRCWLWPSANPADPGTESRRYFISLGWDLAVLQSPGKGAQPALPQDWGSELDLLFSLVPRSQRHF